MTYHNAIKFIKSAPPLPPKKESGADRINKLLEAIGNPQKKIKYIRLAGSNGKTLCARMMISILKKAKIKSGCLSMPIYDEIRNNIRIEGEPISMESTVFYAEQVYQAVSTVSSAENGFTPTRNEIMLCMALLAFADNKCALCMIESDHNGEDPSRFLPPPIAAVICGKIPKSDKKEVSKIRSYITRGIQELVSVPQDQESFKILSDTCFEANCRLTIPSMNSFEITRLTLRGSEFVFDENAYSIRLCGKFQTANAVLSIETAEMLTRLGYEISRQHIKDGLATVTAPCKFEILSLSPTIIADSTHSPVAIGAVCDSLADFKEMLGSKIRLCLPVGELVPHYIDTLEERGYDIEKISVLNEEAKAVEDYGRPVNVHKTLKLTIKDALANLDSDITLLISGPSNFTRRLRYELLATLGF